MTAEELSDMNLSEETLKKVEEEISRFPQKRSAALPLLHLVQEEQGYISDEAMHWIAGKLDLEPINILELVTFYPHFRQKPIGKRLIRICRTLSCALLGSEEVCEGFKKEFDCDLDEVSPGGEATIQYVECLAACNSAPVVMVDDELYENVDEGKIKEIAQKIKSEN